uniref:MAK10-like protein n=1 Tax=Tanacetum cinerariifolium TaxID=118510 RepID=A0A6L2KAP0_TANCI|nr:MAK10-like protein [Tanacetum cinerariifolium]
MHNNIMAAGSRDRLPMLATGRYAQWQSRFMRYADTKPNSEAMRKCILQGPYKLSTITIPGQPVIDESPEVEEQTVLETFSNITPEKKAHYDAKKEAIHLILTGIEDDIYSTVDACKTAHDMWIAVERHFAKECRKPKRDKDYTYHKENMLLCKQAEKGVPFQAEQADWLEDINEDLYEQELEVHYMYMAKIQEVYTTASRPSFDAEPLEKEHSDDDYNVDSNVIPNSSDMCDNDNQADQNTKECDDERDVLANLTVNLILDTDENKKIQKQLKKANTSLSHELQKTYHERDANPIRTLGDYFGPSHEGYRNAIQLHEGNNVVPLRSGTIRLVQNGCSFHELWYEDPNQHLKDFLILVDSLDLDVANRERTRLCLFSFLFTVKLAIALNVFQQDPSPRGRILLLFSLLNSFYQEGLQNFAMTS